MRIGTGGNGYLTDKQGDIGDIFDQAIWGYEPRIWGVYTTRNMGICTKKLA